jgi:ABC-type transporter Mla MlaB component
VTGVAELTSTRTPDGLRLEVKGEVDIVGIEDLRAELPPETTSGTDVLLDLTGVTLLDSTGLAGLLTLRATSTRAAGVWRRSRRTAARGGSSSTWRASASCSGCASPTRARRRRPRRGRAEAAGRRAGVPQLARTCGLASLSSCAGHPIADRLAVAGGHDLQQLGVLHRLGTLSEDRPRDRSPRARGASRAAHVAVAARDQRAREVEDVVLGLEAPRRSARLRLLPARKAVAEQLRAARQATTTMAGQSCGTALVAPTTRARRRTPPLVPEAFRTVGGR